MTDAIPIRGAVTRTIYQDRTGREWALSGEGRERQAITPDCDPVVHDDACVIVDRRGVTFMPGPGDDGEDVTEFTVSGDALAVLHAWVGGCVREYDDQFCNRLHRVEVIDVG